ncbi:hypothetical protein P167DRAFT_539730 [Morchella conica CCBAS932]|uniref:Uncharacterized protein n=1 Tax=Morchella conica CCBAS932 TaxID=1392247 RepID=A0A3N4KBP9_9PEZI|nr:hypothetical protein P167DRAFT_539730 [Morchella conica CCBAS932]
MWQPNHLEMYLTVICSTLPQEPQMDYSQLVSLNTLVSLSPAFPKQQRLRTNNGPPAGFILPTRV